MFRRRCCTSFMYIAIFRFVISGCCPWCVMELISVIYVRPGSILYTLYSILYTLYSILYTLYFILYTLYSILYTLYSILYTLYSILYTLYSILYTLHSILYILYCIIYTQSSILYTLCSLLCTLYTLSSTSFQRIGYHDKFVWVHIFCMIGFAVLNGLCSGDVVFDELRSLWVRRTVRMRSDLSSNSFCVGTTLYA